MENKTVDMISLEDLIAFQAKNKTGRTTNWIELGSKRSLRESGLLTQEQLTKISQITGTFNFSVHVDKKWVIVTLYSQKTKAYKFMAVDLSTMKLAPMDSIKNAKKWVEEQIAAENNTSENETADEGVVDSEVSGQEATEEAPAEVHSEDREPKSTKRNKK
jgi:hypothetical protein